MFLLSLISYSIYTNDPPVVFAYHKTTPITENDFDSFYNAHKNDIIVIRSNGTLRKSQIAEYIGVQCEGGASVDLSRVRVYKPTSQLPSILEGENVRPVGSAQQVCDILKEDYQYIVAAEATPTVGKVGYSNPFTPGVWNCFFMIIICIAFIIWSMIHYASIDVQTRFAKKIN
ncbi:hypothetical protein TRFO_11114 [Tritrichomonas foetus]|uniref:Uncharacterized protein n=1 Tax=Tritrichomonas foetus TaxID=1144522 RepID=A0A1J4J5H3_9EUKA|nr:hypothetical protein TRFO_11114 [Tritrichomonas foetus]|eukprot:OHS94490.1 hypothetical protein TRFO_11114 [Tritrichomonas foetus]